MRRHAVDHACRGSSRVLQLSIGYELRTDVYMETQLYGRTSRSYAERCELKFGTIVYAQLSRAVLQLSSSP